MANFLVIHRASALIVNVVSSSADLRSNARLKVIKIGEQTLNQYYRLKGLAEQAGREGVEVSALTKLSDSFTELLKHSR